LGGGKGKGRLVGGLGLGPKHTIDYL